MALLIKLFVAVDLLSLNGMVFFHIIRSGWYIVCFQGLSVTMLVNVSI